jgi:8-oxo-dGTP pyrophosphatase MutT (NUDIX family)
MNDNPERFGEDTQVAALCYRLRRGGKFQILLITSRNTGRWIPPKGWPIEGKPPHEAAAHEALEEAGVLGKACPRTLGDYKYFRDPETDFKRSAEAFIYPLKVKGFARTFKEKGERRVRWFSAKEAARRVREPGLKRIIRSFDPDDL